MIATISVTALALLYVHQQVELVKLSYTMDIKERNLEHMLDRKDGLRYNIKSLEGPSRLEKVLLSRKIDIAFPKRGQIVAVGGAPINPRIMEPLKAAGIEKKAIYLRVFEFLGLRAEAQAREK